MKSLREKSPSRRGLTLLELVIVLTIIVAIAGVAVAMFPRLLTRAHVASCSANIPELLKAIQMYEAVSLDGYPDRVDTLCVGGALAAYLPNLADISAGNLEEDEVDALHAAGMVEVTTMIARPGGASDWHASFWPYIDGAPGIVTLDESTSVAFLDPVAAQRLGLASEGDERYVVFGLGSLCKMFGRTMNEAPVHFSDAMDGNPNDRYMRFVAIYQVGGRRIDTSDPGYDPADPGTWVYEYNTLPRARLRAVAAIHPGGLEGLAGHVQEYWQEVESDN
jgi:prepilin-type N-terminal cleavage/methylation domain-containing protein